MLGRGNAGRRRLGRQVAEVVSGQGHHQRDRHGHSQAGHERAPGPIGLQSIGGVIKHLGALTSIGSSTVNSYRRLWDTGFWAPVFADWGYQNRTCALRVSAPGRFEYRSVDSMVNPYLMGAVLLAAIPGAGRAESEGRRLDVLIQTSLCGEPQKGGCEPDDLPALARQPHGIHEVEIRLRPGPGPLVQRIRGILPHDVEVEDYRRHLEEKHA